MNEPTSHEPTSHEPKKKSSRWLYTRVLIVQAVTLILLYWLQAAYGGG